MRRTLPWFRVLPLLALGAIALGAFALRPEPALAQPGEGIGVYSELLVVQRVNTHCQPSRTSPICHVLEPNQVVYVHNRFLGPEGTLWGTVTRPDGFHLGFVELASQNFTNTAFVSVNTGGVIGWGFNRLLPQGFTVVPGLGLVSTTGIGFAPGTVFVAGRGFVPVSSLGTFGSFIPASFFGPVFGQPRFVEVGFR